MSSNCPNSRWLITAGAAQDAAGNNARPAALLVEDGQVRWIGTPENAPDGLDAKRIDRRNCLVLPALVNAHTHLDLTAIGPQPPAAGFARWVDALRRARPADPVSIEQSTTRGIELSLAGGTAVVGDIAGNASTIPLTTLQKDKRLTGICFVEFFGLSARDEPAAQAMTALAADVATARSTNTIAPGLQPHAPYSASRRLYEHAARLAGQHKIRCATHLAETREELEFTTRGSGPIADFLERINVWDSRSDVPGLHPLEALIDPLTAAPWTIAHLNYPPDNPELLDRLAAAGSSVVYCPRAHAYFNHADHPCRTLIRHGVNVALGTDSILCLDTPDRISILDEMRLLYRRDHFDPRLLLEMATINGAKALGLNPDHLTFKSGPVVGLIAVPFDPADQRDPLEQVLSHTPVEFRHTQQEIQWITNPGGACGSDPN